MPLVRQARSSDRFAVTEAAAAAFAGDPAWTFLLGDDYDDLAPHFAGALFDLRVDAGDVWITGDAAALAMWDPPGGHGAAAARSEEVWAAFRARGGAAVSERLTEYGRAVDAARPERPHWYLSVLATHPDHQGKGLASAVIAPIIGKADIDGLDCCLETSTEKNRAFYGRRGFTESTELRIAGGPPTWWLRRSPPSS
jgi:GNAT superfamily N-acetyltransferase